MARRQVPLLEHAWFMKVGRPPRAFEDYDPLTLQALLLHTKALVSELDNIVQEAESDDDEWIARQERTMGERIEGKKRKRRCLDYDQPVETGDPVVDEWERAIARGEIPDLDAPGDARKVKYG